MNLVEIKIDTLEVRTVASNVKSVCNDIEKQYESLESSMSALMQCWYGEVSEKANEVFSSFKTSYCQNLNTVLYNYSDMLSKVVAEGYEQGEESNKRLADQFK